MARVGKSQRTRVDRGVVLTWEAFLHRQFEMNSLMFRTCYVSLVSLTVACSLLVGCGQEVAVEPYEPEDFEGSVDPSLSKSVQRKQDAIIRLFTAIQEVGIDQTNIDCPDIEFRETFEEFFGDAADFYRWDWAEQPKGNAFPVRIILRKDEPGLPQVEVKRTYSVTNTANGFAIKRVVGGGK